MATCLANLAELPDDTNHIAEAEPLMDRALAVREQTLGSDHPATVTARNKLARLEAVLRKAGERGAAES